MIQNKLDLISGVYFRKILSLNIDCTILIKRIQVCDCNKLVCILLEMRFVVVNV